ncbi:Integral membrane sensor signal transduction histidine kinase [uncultured Sphingopyxis sp.]|uniref:histidine kinase n=1 Tax=uncultured Sphingopyxis sp. TaxID=310581 RepID=A0A1Y5PYF0_9SPHN|nr:CHASE2 domain-containing protein [uncultured Sphingopyxis sp.]SBV35063.1 Integral membrane sensor signal transduction histidine kinase [uncultured Sphingopyxis sp.]
MSSDPVTLPRSLRLEWWCVGLLATAVSLFLVLDRSSERIDLLIYDMVVSRQRQDPDPRILLVAVDQEALGEAGAWPWSRETHARLVRRLSEGRPSAIAYDVLFVESKPADAALASAIADTPIFLPLLFDAPGRDGRAFDIVPPPASLHIRSEHLGHVNLIVDRDGQVRRLRPYDGNANISWPHLMERTRSFVDGSQPSSEARRNPILIDYAGPPGHFPSISAAAILRREFPEELLQGRIILVGVTAPGLADTYPTPMNEAYGTMSGLEIQANFLNGLLAGRDIREAPTLARLLFVILPLWLLMLSFLWLRPRHAAAHTAFLASLVLGTSITALLRLGVWLPPASALLTLAILYPLWGWRRLTAVSHYMIDELEALRTEPDLLSRSYGGGALDPVSRQVQLLSHAVGQLRDIKRFISDSLDQLPDAIFVLTPHGAILLANAAGQALFEITAPLLPPHINSLLSKMLPDTAPSKAPESFSFPQLLERSPSGEPSSPEMLMPDGRCFALRTAPRVDGSGQQVGWILRMSDISAVWEARRERRDTLRFLSHDMRAPLMSVLALLATAKPEALAPSLAERLRRHTWRTLDLADGFLQLARAQSLRFQPMIVNLSDLLKDAIDQLWPQITEMRIKFDTNGDNRELLILGEASLLTRAFVNLIQNAIKYGGEGATVTCTLAIEFADNCPLATCTVSDNGPGVTPATMKNIFHSFERGTGAHGQGAGLGLTFVQAVARRHGGTVRCTSGRNKGTAFTLSLPLLP